jgi:hypothetical protein
MSKARRGQRSAPALGTSRQRRQPQDELRCDQDAIAAAQALALRALEDRLGQASCAAHLYDLALRTVRCAHPSACAALLEFDAESLSSCRSDVVPSSGRSRHLVDRIAAAPLSIDADDLWTINYGRQDGPASLESLLERRLGLCGLVVGRVRLDGAVVALLLLRPSSAAALDRDRTFVNRVTDRVSTRMDAAMDTFWASVSNGSP